MAKQTTQDMTADSEIEEEFFLKKGHKEEKQQKKIASSTDRSQFKKTDKKKLAAHLKLKQNKQLKGKQLHLGRVTAMQPSAVRVESDNQIYTCSLRGLLKKEVTRNHNLLAVGDLVHFEIQDKKQEMGTIEKIEERTSVLSRPNAFSKRKQQILAANIDLVLITTSTAAPPLQSHLIDRYIIAAKKGNMSPVLLVNKADLVDRRAKSSAFLKEIITVYTALNIPVLLISVLKNQGFKELKAIMKNKTSVFSGQSGVGKSSLINVLTHSNLPIGEISEKKQKGVHTTTRSQLIRLDEGGWCIDTPGIESFGIGDITAQELKHYFAEIHQVGQSCKFANCMHLEEPECAVLKAVNTNTIASIRFNSYKKLLLQALKGKDLW